MLVTTLGQVIIESIVVILRPAHSPSLLTERLSQKAGSVRALVCETHLADRVHFCCLGNPTKGAQLNSRRVGLAPCITALAWLCVLHASHSPSQL